ncbi:poly-gamma-glutamate biosynthesis protein PgsC [Leptospira yasudae]|uniref:poly-gamma-glutamate biosynthesis protein PgsC n=1 Tax=Leptospira yasudae TaxID=2202201 RepID=UPI0010846E48|nr:poly-gamma-glutamate biosynthesis protein PgsC [Leptospira yasudae]TGK25743.1 poly-gamma-glutamate biosynthesis protein PgsC [Leptospira yasudae]TGM02843.1 poly-gamma-glutamate biosynthesis protein PgsC [Leptospira yasudae]
MELVTVSIGIGILFGFLLWERTGLHPGGWVVPGYIALYLNRPWVLIPLFLSSILTLVVYRLSESFFLSFGQRKTVFILLLSILFSLFSDFLVTFYLSNTMEFESRTIGHIVPGLIMLSAERQGVFRTASAILTASVLVRLFLILVFGEAIRG